MISRQEAAELLDCNPQTVTFAMDVDSIIVSDIQEWMQRHKEKR